MAKDTEAAELPPTNIPEARDSTRPAVNVEMPVAVYVRELSDRARSEIREDFMRWLVIRAGIIGPALAIIVLFFGNGHLRSLVLERIDLKLVDIDKAKVDAAVAAAKAISSANDADKVATVAMGRSKEIEAKLLVLNTETKDVATQVAQFQTTVRGAIDAAVEAAVAQIEVGGQEGFATNSRIPVYLSTSDYSQAFDIVRNLSLKGFRVTPIPQSESFKIAKAEIVYSCAWSDQHKEAKEMYRRAAEAFQLSYPIREELEIECDARVFPRGVTILLP